MPKMLEGVQRYLLKEGTLGTDVEDIFPLLSMFAG
jgi:hypothetical protein